MTPVVRNLLIACVAVFLLQQVSIIPIAYFALWPVHGYPGDPPFEIWQLLSYSFLHGNFLHIFLNMYALWMFGSDIERLVGSRRFTVYYFVCVLTAALAQLVVQRLEGGISGPTVGASGGIFGILLAYALAFPQRRLMIIPIPVPMPAWLLVTLYGLIELYLGVSGREASVAHFAHIGGMIGGFALILYWRYGRTSRR